MTFIENQITVTLISQETFLNVKVTEKICLNLWSFLQLGLDIESRLLILNCASLD